MTGGLVKIEDLLVILSMLAVLGLGFIPVFFLNRFLNRVRRPVIDSTKAKAKKAPNDNGRDDDPLAEFERLGEVRFDNREAAKERKK